MNDNNKMDRGKEHAGPKKMTPRQKQKRNRKATLAAVLCFVAAIAIVGTYTMRDYKTVKKRRGARKSTTGGTEESTGGSQSGSKWKCTERQCFRVRNGWSRNRWKSRKEWLWCRNGRDCKQKCCNSRKHRWIRK